MEPKDSTITTVEALKAAYPDLTAAIESNARAEERNRIKAIKDAAVDGFENIVEDAMFKNPISAESMALKILNEQKKHGGVYMENRGTDVANSGMNGVGAAAGVTGAEDKDPFNAAIDKLFPDK